MAQIVTRVRYDDKPNFGLIRLTRCAKSKPLSYSLTLYHEVNGFIDKNKEFTTVDKAVNYAILKGFKSSLWVREEKPA